MGIARGRRGLGPSVRFGQQDRVRAPARDDRKGPRGGRRARFCGAWGGGSGFGPRFGSGLAQAIFEALVRRAENG